MLRELQHEDTELDELDLEAPLELAGPLEVRRAMIRLQQLDRDEERTKETKAAVAASYDQQLERIQRDREYLRRSLDAYVRTHGPAKFPDVGTAYLSKTKTKLEIEDEEAFKAELGSMFVKEQFDTTAAKAYALEQFEKTGELPPGTKVIPADKTLAVRKA